MQKTEKDLSKKSGGIDGMDVIIADGAFHHRLICGEKNSQKKQPWPKLPKK